MSAETIIALMLAAFVASSIIGHVVAFWLRGHVCAAAFAVIAYLVSCLGMVIYALS